MTSLRVRQPAFRIDASVPFQWQPANPNFGLFTNAFTFLAIAFERYIVAATRQAMPRITDPVIAEEADAFLRQEAQHARAHRAHANAMIGQHPRRRH
jgi:predicted metal-dependent hydrolase